MDQSKFIIDGTEMSYDDWKDDDDKAASAFSSLCSSWARDMNKRGLTTLGIKVTLPDIGLQPETAVVLTIHYEDGLLICGIAVDLKENPTFCKPIPHRTKYWRGVPNEKNLQLLLP